MLPTTTDGAFMPTIDWTNPDFSPYDLRNLVLRSAQRKELLREDIDEECSPILTTEQQIELCRTVPCRVELFHSNVCKGVEKGWPKRMFDKATFEELTPKEQRCIHRMMQGKKAVLLYDTYVSEQRLAERRRRRTSRALAPYYEKLYRKNLYEHIVAMGKPAPGYDAVIDDSDSSMIEWTDNEAEASQQSIVTIINTGKTATQQSNTHTDEIDENDLSDNDCSSDVMSENAEPPTEKRPSTNRKSKTTHAATQKFPIHAIECLTDASVTSADNVPEHDTDYDVEQSDNSESTSTKNTNVQQTQHGGRAGVCSSQATIADLVFATPRFRGRESQQADVADDADAAVNSDGDADSLDFLGEGILARTSTQQSNK